jgi:hypothetical protein
MAYGQADQAITPTRRAARHTDHVTLPAQPSSSALDWIRVCRHGSRDTIQTECVWIWEICRFCSADGTTAERLRYAANRPFVAYLFGFRGPVAIRRGVNHNPSSVQPARKYALDWLRRIYRVATHPNGARRLSIQGMPMSIGPRHGSGPRPWVAKIAGRNAEAGKSARVKYPVVAASPSVGGQADSVTRRADPPAASMILTQSSPPLGEPNLSRALPCAPSGPGGFSALRPELRTSALQGIRPHAGDIVHRRFASRRPRLHVRGLQPRWKSAGSNVEQSRNRSDP